MVGLGGTNWNESARSSAKSNIIDDWDCAFLNARLCLLLPRLQKRLLGFYMTDWGDDFSDGADDDASTVPVVPQSELTNGSKQVGGLGAQQATVI